MVLFCSSWRRQSICLANLGVESESFIHPFFLLSSFFSFLPLETTLPIPRYGSSYMGMPPGQLRRYGSSSEMPPERPDSRFRDSRFEKEAGPYSENRGCVNELNSFICACANEFNHLEFVRLRMRVLISAFRNENKRFGMTGIRTPDLEHD